MQPTPGFSQVWVTPLPFPLTSPGGKGSRTPKCQFVPSSPLGKTSKGPGPPSAQGLEERCCPLAYFSRKRGGKTSGGALEAAIARGLGPLWQSSPGMKGLMHLCIAQILIKGLLCTEYYTNH